MINKKAGKEEKGKAKVKERKSTQIDETRKKKAQ